MNAFAQKLEQSIPTPSGLSHFLCLRAWRASTSSLYSSLGGGEEVPCFVGERRNSESPYQTDTQFSLCLKKNCRDMAFWKPLQMSALGKRKWVSTLALFPL